MFSFSFQPDGRWFVFEISTGRTVERGLSFRRACESAAKMNVIYG